MDASLHAHDLAFDSDGNLYIADWVNNRLRLVGPQGTIATAAGTGQPPSVATVGRRPRPRSAT